jgi:hypothetical protein
MNLGRKIRRIDSAVSAEHPVLIKSLGAAALTIAMKKIAEQHAG